MTRHLPAECATCGTEFRAPVDEDGAADAVCGGCVPAEREIEAKRAALEKLHDAARRLLRVGREEYGSERREAIKGLARAEFEVAVLLLGEDEARRWMRERRAA